ncbi:hypothetical protein Sango_0056900 [Sesamum angolense]|uniref:Calmodulin-binding domain-containing protein n=1 Tax=Sesamum angolense TaxID=2727404 RepID=A0AAE1XDN4_9LAMI|nr:hypothetical protein Sango_0056900 [Sesamum angolense]
MAEGSSDPLLTSEEKVFSSMNLGINSAGNPRSLNNVCRRASVGSYRAGNNARRRHSVYSNSENVSRCVVPRYLRASTGSCHDLCKFGRRQSCGEKVRKPLRRRTAKTSPNELLPVVIVVAGKQKTEKVVKHEPSADTERRSRVVKPSPDAKSYSSKFKASLDAKVCSPRQNASSSNETCLPNSPTKNSTPSHPTAIIKRRILSPSEKVEVPVKEANSIDRKISRTGKKTYDQYLKCSSSVKSKSVNVKRSSASDNLDDVLGKGRLNSVVKNSRRMTASTASARRASVTPAAPLFPKSSPSKTASIIARKSGRVKLLSPLKVRTRTQRAATETSNNENSKKTLPVITMGTEKLKDIPDDHAIAALSFSSSPKSLSQAKSASSLSCEVEEEEVKHSDHKADELVSDNTACIENGSVLAVKENQDKTPRIGTENNSLESIPDYHVIPALSSPSSPKSLSHAKSPSLLSHEEDHEEIKHNGNKAVEFVLEKTVSIEIGNTQTVKENQNKMPRIRTEKRALESIPEDHASALLSPSSPKSLSHANSPSLEEHDVIKHNACEGKSKKAVRKSRLVLSEDKYCLPVKLKFRSGKVVDLPSEKNTPRRIIFRRSRSSGNKAEEGFVSDNKKSMEIGTLAPVRENQDKISRKSRVVVSEHKPRSPVKSFRNQQVVDLQSGKNSTRILRFRRPRVAWPEDGKVDLKRRIFERNGGKDDAAGAELCSGKIILKHQDVQGKTDVKILLNNVLEETASKLVESRKGKVKALVGAFETVISLHERKRTLRIVG